MGAKCLVRLKPYVTILLLLFFLVEYSGLASASPAIRSSASNEKFRYEFIIDDDGVALVRIVYSSDGGGGSSWVLVPKFSKWLNYTVNGIVYKSLIEDSEKYIGSSLYFYDALNFSFISTGRPFRMVIEYNFSLAAMIVESESKYGIFYSPQIGFEQGSGFEAMVVFPQRFRWRLNEALIVGRSGSYRADTTLSNSSHIFFRNLPPSENVLRIQVGFEAIDGRVDYIVLRSGIFEFRTVARYESYARQIINLYNVTYDSLARLFNTTLEGVTVRFFVPDYYSLMSIGGYVPFTGGRLGDIHINLMFLRYMEGYIEVIALHELIHHFLWKAGISPERFLWFHEGMAQYISMEVAEGIGYKGAEVIREETEKSAEETVRLLGGKLGFLTMWTPSYAPRDVGTLYAAAYYVVSRLAEKRGGLDYYAKFFRYINGKNIEDNVMLCYYLSLAAGESIFEEFNSWGFNLPDIYIYQSLLTEVDEAIKGIDSSNLLLQPFKKLAELLYNAAVSGRGINTKTMQLYLLAALYIAKLAPAIALLTYSCIIFTVLIIILKLRGVF